MRAVTFGAVELMAITGLAQIQRSPAQTPSSVPGGAEFSDGGNRHQLVTIIKIAEDSDGAVTSRILTHLLFRCSGHLSGAWWRALPVRECDRQRSSSRGLTTRCRGLRRKFQPSFDHVAAELAGQVSHLG
jgi:hypothetical protein